MSFPCFPAKLSRRCARSRAVSPLLEGGKTGCVGAPPVVCLKNCLTAVMFRAIVMVVFCVFLNTLYTFLVTFLMFFCKCFCTFLITFCHFLGVFWWMFLVLFRTFLDTFWVFLGYVFGSFWGTLGHFLGVFNGCVLEAFEHSWSFCDMTNFLRHEHFTCYNYLPP